MGIKRILKNAAMVLLLCAALPLAAQNSANRSTVTVDVKDAKGGQCRWYVEAVPMSPPGEDSKKDTILMRNGTFSYTIDSDTLYEVCFQPEPAVCGDKAGDTGSPDMMIEVFVERGSHQTVKATLADGYTDYSVAGSPLSATYAERLSAFRRANSARIRTLIMAMVNPQSDSIATARANDEYSAIYDKYRSSNLEYARQHPGEQIAAAYIIENATGSLLCAEAEKLAPEVRNGQFKPILDSVIKVYSMEKGIRDDDNKVRLGVDAPAFSYTTTDGKRASQDMFKGKKYLVLDFWGSWCAWCLRGVPKMREYRDKYADRLEILGINCNDKPERMKAAIEKHNINWLHIVNDISSLDRNMTVKYAVQAFPTKILISPEGKIAAYIEGEEESFYETIDKLMK